MSISVAAMPMLTFPVPGLEIPARPAWPPILDPPIWHPIIAAMHRYPTPGDPDVPTALPGPIAWCPDIAGTWRGDHFNLRRWRSDIDVQIEIDPGDCWCAQRRQSTQCNEYAL